MWIYCTIRWCHFIMSQEFGYIPEVEFDKADYQLDQTPDGADFLRDKRIPRRVECVPGASGTLSRAHSVNSNLKNTQFLI